MPDFKGRKDFPEVADDKIKIGDYSGMNRLSIVDIYSPKEEPVLRDQMMESVDDCNNYDSPILSHQPVIVLSDTAAEEALIKAIDGYVGKQGYDPQEATTEQDPRQWPKPPKVYGQTFLPRKGEETKLNEQIPMKVAGTHTETGQEHLVAADTDETFDGSKRQDITGGNPAAWNKPKSDSGETPFDGTKRQRIPKFTPEGIEIPHRGLEKSMDLEEESRSWSYQG